MKYIIVKERETGTQYAILFPRIDILSHKELARRVSPLLDIMSAGFVDIGYNREKLIVKTYGESLSLNMKPRLEDTLIIEELFMEHNN